MLTNPKGGSDISSEDPIRVIFGKEHPGRVRGLSYGACPQPCFQKMHNKAKWYELCFL